MELTFLGTSSMVPTKERNVSGIFLSYKSEGILFDCGEGTQRQMNITGIKRTKITKILVSHWHGDHIGGLIGLIQTLGNEDNLSVVEIYGPNGTKKYMSHLLKSCYFDVKIGLKIVELNPQSIKTFFENEDFILECALLDHGIPCLGYSFIEKNKLKVNTEYLKKNNILDGPHLRKLQEGKSIVYKGKKVNVKNATFVVEGKKVSCILDTALCTNAIKLAKDADILISEAVYTSELAEKGEKYKHMTSKDAALLANKAGVKKLVLTHFSQRYKNSLPLQDDAAMYFDNVICADDYMKLNL
ncbi:ribonuclease Z [Candidatus Woesearchaeota archaeon]|nr:ribonuclease Z [Candidatus Woesearchaeota archaeon]